MPQKKYIVRLTPEEREVCRATIRKLNGSSERVRRAQILLKADADGPRVDRPADRRRLLLPHLQCSFAYLYLTDAGHGTSHVPCR